MSLSSSIRQDVAGAVKTFEATIDGLVSTLGFVDISERLRPRVGSVLNRGSMDAELRSLVDDYISRSDSYSSQIHPALIVVAYGSFEQYLRRFIEVVVSAICKEVDTVDNLPDAFQEEHIFRTGRALASIRDPRDHIKYDYVDIARTLGSCGAGEASYSLNHVVFGVDIGALNQASIDNLLRRVGAGINWDDIARRRAIQDIVGEDGVRRCKKGTIALLQEIASVRNSIAHTGTPSITLSTTDTVRYLEFIKSVAEGITTLSIAALARRYR